MSSVELCDWSVGTPAASVENCLQVEHAPFVINALREQWPKMTKNSSINEADTFRSTPDITIVDPQWIQSSATAPGLQDVGKWRIFPINNFLEPKWKTNANSIDQGDGQELQVLSIKVIPSVFHQCHIGLWLSWLSLWTNRMEHRPLLRLPPTNFKVPLIFQWPRRFQAMDYLAIFKEYSAEQMTASDLSRGDIQWLCL